MIMLVGNKSDLRHLRSVQTDDAQVRLKHHFLLSTVSTYTQVLDICERMQSLIPCMVLRHGLACAEDAARWALCFYVTIS